MNRIYIITIILLVAALIFAIQNTAATELHFLFWKFQGSQALMTILMFVVGFIAGWILEARKVWIRNSKIKTIQKKLDEMQKAVNTASGNASK